MRCDKVTTYCSVGVEILLILGNLQLDPLRLWIAETMPFSQGRNGLFPPVAHKQPSWALGNEVDEEDNQTGEEHLKPSRNQPRHIASQVQASSNSARGQDGSSEPEGIAVRGDDSSPSRMCCFDDVNGASGRDYRHAETEEKATTFQLRHVACNACSSVDNCADDDNRSADEHANLASPGIDGRSYKWQRDDSSNLIHGGVDSLPFTIDGAMEEFEEGLVCGETAEQGAIEAVHGLTEASEKHASNQSNRSRMPEPWWLSEQCLVKGFTALDHAQFDKARLVGC